MTCLGYTHLVDESIWMSTATVIIAISIMVSAMTIVRFVCFVRIMVASGIVLVAVVRVVAIAATAGIRLKSSIRGIRVVSGIVVRVVAKVVMTAIRCILFIGVARAALITSERVASIDWLPLNVASVIFVANAFGWIVGAISIATMRG